MHMLKHLIALILISIAIIVGITYAQIGLQWLVNAHDWVANILMDVFSGGKAGDITRQLLALLAIPVAVGLVPVIIYGFAKRQMFPYFMTFVWVIWLVQTAALVIQYKVG
jgi:hypothetical protein